MCIRDSRRVVATTGSITDQLREDWQLVDVMKELNLPKYEALGFVETYEDKDGRKIKRKMCIRDSRIGYAITR